MLTHMGHGAFSSCRARFLLALVGDESTHRTARLSQFVHAPHRWSVIKEPEDLANNQDDYSPCNELDFWAGRARELQTILIQVRTSDTARTWGFRQLLAMGDFK
jgi:hypothetical protein